MTPSFGTSITPGSSRAGLLLSAMLNPSPFYPRNDSGPARFTSVSAQESTDPIQPAPHPVPRSASPTTKRRQIRLGEKAAPTGSLFSNWEETHKQSQRPQREQSISADE